MKNKSCNKIAMTLTISGFNADGTPSVRVISGVADISRSKKREEFVKSAFNANISGDLSEVPQFDMTFFNSRYSMLKKVFGLSLFSLDTMFSLVLETEPIFGCMKWVKVNSERGEWKYV